MNVANRKLSMHKTENLKDLTDQGNFFLNENKTTTENLEGFPAYIFGDQ